MTQQQALPTTGIATNQPPASTEVKKEEVATPQTGTAAVYDVMAPVLQNDMVVLEGLNMGERIRKFDEFREKLDCNLPLMEQSILSQMAPGTKFVILPIRPSKSDSWPMTKILGSKHPDNEGRVEPSADFMIRLASMLNIYLDKIHEGMVTEDGVKMWSCRYSAFWRLPSGEMISVQDEGKDVPAINKDGSMTAHIIEATRKKAKRNAIKALLGIPTVMDKTEFERPWILLRPIFTDPEILEENKQIAAKATASLYNRSALEASPDEVTDIEPYKKLMDAASTLGDLDAVAKQFKSLNLQSGARSELGAYYVNKKKQFAPPAESGNNNQSPQSEDSGF